MKISSWITATPPVVSPSEIILLACDGNITYASSLDVLECCCYRPAFNFPIFPLWGRVIVGSLGCMTNRIVIKPSFVRLKQDLLPFNSLICILTKCGIRYHKQVQFSCLWCLKQSVERIQGKFKLPSEPVRVFM